jgi:hypothetical protein
LLARRLPALDEVAQARVWKVSEIEGQQDRGICFDCGSEHMTIPGIR